MKDKWGKVIERRNANQRAYTARNRDAINARLAIKRSDPEWRAQKRAADRARYEQNQDKARAWQLQYRYGLSADEYAAIVASQGGRCAVCARVPSGKGKKSATLHVDHDHTTGHVRGLLCDACNRAIGLLGDSVAKLTSAAMYLARAGRRSESA